MNIDVRKLIVNTLFTISVKTERKSISWDDVAKYVCLLEKKLGKKINLINTDEFNTTEYEKYVITRVEKDNVYFDLNPKFYNKKFTKSIVDIRLLLDENSNNELTGRDRIYKKTCGINSVSFNSLFKLFMYIYIKRFGKSIDRNDFWCIFTEIKNTLNKCGVEIKNATKLELFRTVYMYDKSQKFNLKDNNVNSNITDFNKFEYEATYSFDNETLKFLTKVIEYHLINLNVQEIKKEKKH